MAKSPGQAVFDDVANVGAPRSDRGHRRNMIGLKRVLHAEQKSQPQNSEHHRPALFIPYVRRNPTPGDGEQQTCEDPYSIALDAIALLPWHACKAARRRVLVARPSFCSAPSNLVEMPKDKRSERAAMSVLGFSAQQWRDA
jgi:hypothetical protein